MSDTRTHLHRLDHPYTIDLLLAVIGDRPIAGWERTDEGYWVDFNGLLDSYLSSTEKAAIHIARGCAIAEPRGGFSKRVAATTISTIKAVAR